MLLRARTAVARRRQWLFVSASTKEHVSFSFFFYPLILLVFFLFLRPSRGRASRNFVSPRVSSRNETQSPCAVTNRPSAKSHRQIITT